MMRGGMRPLRGASRYLPVCLDQERASDRCTCRPIGAGDCAVVRLRSGLEKSLDLAQRGWAFSCTCTAGLIHFIHYWSSKQAGARGVVVFGGRCLCRVMHNKL